MTRARPWWLALLLILTPLAWAQLRTSGEVGLTSGATITSMGGRSAAVTSTVFSAHLEVKLELTPITLNLVLDPAARVDDQGNQGALIEPGLTEAFLQWRRGTLRASAGIERLPLQSARLTVPFGIEPSGKTGLPQGLLGARFIYAAGGWRLRPAAFITSPLDAPKVGGVLSIRRYFTSFDLEAHVVYLDGFRFGLGGSGLVGDLVLYGEGWLLLAPLAGRGAVGLSGFLGDGLWTIEVAFAPLPSSVPLPGGPTAIPQLQGQFSLPQGDAGNWNFTAGAGLATSRLNPGSGALQGLIGFGYSQADDDYQLTIGPTVIFSETATIYGLNLDLRGFF